MIFEIAYSDKHAEAPGMLEELELFPDITASDTIVFWPVQLSSELWCLQVASPMMFKGKMPVLAKPFFKWWSPIFPLAFECKTKEDYIQNLIDNVAEIVVDGWPVYTSELAAELREVDADFNYLMFSLTNTEEVADI